MCVQDVFEEWDDSEVMDMEEIESIMYHEKESSESSEGESTDSADKDGNATKASCVGENAKKDTGANRCF